jgi:putative NADPH-quinone reductase
MSLQTQTSSEFYIKIQDLVMKTKLSYMDAILHYCDMNNMEPETAAQLVNTKMKAQVREEAERLNFLPKTAKLPI